MAFKLKTIPKLKNIRSLRGAKKIYLMEIKDALAQEVSLRKQILQEAHHVYALNPDTEAPRTFDRWPS